MTADQLFREHHLKIFRFLRRATRNQPLAEDLTQEVFVRVVRALPRYRSEGKDEAWIWTIARNVLAHHRRRSATGPAETDPVDDGAPAPQDPPDTRLALDQALGQLGDVDRDIFLLREVAGLGHHEIAAVCELTPDAVRNRIYRARESLRLWFVTGDARRFKKGADR